MRESKVGFKSQSMKRVLSGSSSSNSKASRSSDTTQQLAIIEHTLFTRELLNVWFTTAIKASQLIMKFFRQQRKVTVVKRHCLYPLYSQ